MRLIRCLALFALGLMMVAAAPDARAIDAVSVRSDAPAIDLTAVLDHQRSDTDRIQVSTAPGTDGIVRRIEVRAREGGQNWVVFALANNTDDQLDRLIVAPHYRIVSSGLLWPDLGLSRVATITPSTGDRPERQESATADIYRITLDPGAVITFVAELRTDKLPQLYLWEPDAYKDKVNSFTLYQGIVIGISGLLALVLTILFVVKGSIMFPAAAALAWAVLVYIGVDFGFWGKVLDMSNNAERVWRAAGEAILAATLLVFLFAYLNLSRWHVRYSHITVGWLTFLGSLVALALFDPAVASGIARMSLVLIAFAGFALIVYLSTHGFDRAVLLIPTWFLLVVWVIAAGMTVGRLRHQRHRRPGAARRPRADRDADWIYGHAARLRGRRRHHRHRLRRRTPRAGAGRLRRSDLGLGRLRRQGVYQPRDRELARTEARHAGRPRRKMAGSAASARPGPFPRRARQRARPAPRPAGAGFPPAHARRPLHVVRAEGAPGGRLRRRGLARGRHAHRRHRIKNAEERMLHDSVHDNLTGLPNRKLFIDRLGAVANFAKTMPNLRPTLMVIDLDRFKQVNDSVGIAVGDSILLTLARRLTRILKPQDTLARLAGDQFGLILMSEQDSARITAFAETIRKTIRAPIAFNDREIFLTASIGLALSDPQTQLSEEIIKDAELAMYHSKRIGGDRIDVYKPAMRARKTDRLTLESELRRAIERQEITILYQPIVRLEDRSIAGFEALARWDHPKLGRMSPVEFISIAEEIGLIVDLGMFVMDTTAKQLAVWQRAMRSREPIFASVNVSSRQLLRHDLIHDIRTVLSRSSVARGTLKLELTELLVMENPEHAAQMLTRIRELGTGLSLDDFGTGHSSLAYLQRFPFDTIKIDQSFVRTTSRGTRPVILKSIIALAHDLGMDVVAEGAETDSDAVELYQLGCEYAQGFAFGEPMDADAAMRLLTEERLEAAS